MVIAWQEIESLLMIWSLMTGFSFKTRVLD
jgi:hypothetical protein